jgi:hypothetical protein
MPDISIFQFWRDVVSDNIKKDLYTYRQGNVINLVLKTKTPDSVYTRIKLHWNSQIIYSSTLDVKQIRPLYAETFVCIVGDISQT